MARSLCWSAAWQMTRNGEMKARDFLTLVAQGAATETEIGVLELILAQAREALASYADPDWTEATGRKLLVDALLHGARSSAPGSDYQLAFVKALARTRQTEDSIAFSPPSSPMNRQLRAWLWIRNSAGRHCPSWLAPMPLLRWRRRFKRNWVAIAPPPAITMPNALVLR